MKTILKKATLASGILLGSAGFAQNITKPAPAPAAKVAAMTTEAPMAKRVATWIPLNVDQLKGSMSLKPDQITKVTDLNANFNKRYEMLKKDEATIGATALRGRASALMQERNKQVRMLLDVDQQKKWDMLYPNTHTAEVPTSPTKKDAH